MRSTTEAFTPLEIAASRRQTRSHKTIAGVVLIGLVVLLIVGLLCTTAKVPVIFEVLATIVCVAALCNLGKIFPMTEHKWGTCVFCIRNASGPNVVIAAPNSEPEIVPEYLESDIHLDGLSGDLRIVDYTLEQDHQVTGTICGLSVWFEQCLEGMQDPAKVLMALLKDVPGTPDWGYWLLHYGKEFLKVLTEDPNANLACDERLLAIRREAFGKTGYKIESVAYPVGPKPAEATEHSAATPIPGLAEPVAA